MTYKKNVNHRMFPYQIKYRKDLHVVDEASASDYFIANHFARFGYENLYLTNNGVLKSIVTLEDFLNGNRITGLNREFVRNSNELSTNGSIEQAFFDYPYLDRITVIDDGNLICEIDGLIELPLQNGTAKNLMALRYFDLFEDELSAFFSRYEKILLISNIEIAEFFRQHFTSIHFTRIDDLELVMKEHLCDKNELIIDFIYSKNIRRRLGFAPNNLLSLSKLITRIALKRLIKFSSENGIHTLFYRLQNYKDLTCMNEAEYRNCLNRIKAGRVILDKNYMSRFLTNEKEVIFLRDRDYHASHRLDNGYCFIQDECNIPLVHVHNGIRLSELQDSCSEQATRVFFFGPCTTYGFLSPDEETITSIVHQCAQSDEKSIDVVNCAGIHGYNELNSFMMALNTPVRSGDYLIFYDTLDDLDIDEYPNVRQACDWFNNEKSTDDIWFLDFPGHCNYRANQLIAKHIYNDLRNALDNEIAPNRINERFTYIGDAFDCFKYLSFTHTSCVRFIRQYNEYFFSSDSDTKIGSLIIPDDFDYDRSMCLIKTAISTCDKLYVIKYNSNLSTISLGKRLFEKTEIKVDSKPVRVFQIGYFFKSDKYNVANSDDINHDMLLFIERVLAKVVYRAMNVDTRFTLAADNSYFKDVDLIYSNEGIETVYISA